MQIIHIRFGGGPRGYLGEQYAMLQMLTIRRAVLTKYDMEFDQTIVARIMITLRPKNGIYMIFTVAKELQPTK